MHRRRFDSIEFHSDCCRFLTSPQLVRTTMICRALQSKQNYIPKFEITLEVGWVGPRRTKLLVVMI